MDALRDKDQMPPASPDAPRVDTPIRLVVERTVRGSSRGNKVDVRPILELLRVDHHFVPSIGGSDEDLRITYRIRGLSREEVKLRISSPKHDPAVLYERSLTKEERTRGREKTIRWNGMTNCTSGPLKDRAVYPLIGPLDVELVHSKYNSRVLQTRVLYRDVRLEELPWAEVFKAVTGLASKAYPIGGTTDQKLLWFQYKLNEMGYCAGPLTDPPDQNAIRRALYRYTQANPELPKIIDCTTLPTPGGTCQWGWKAQWEAQFGTLPELCTGGVKPHGDKLVQLLEGDERPIADIVENRRVFADRRSNSRIILNHNLFYLNKDFSTADANAEYDAEFLNPFCWPLQARVTLLSRTDHDGSKPGIKSPEAVGDLETEWLAFDPAEDISQIPPPVKAHVNLKSRTRDYITDMHRKLAGQFGDELNALDNCPRSAGGRRPDDPGDMSPFFVKIKNDNLFPGSSVIIFNGSYIGGDNYIVQARISVEGAPGGATVESDHRGITGLKDAFNDPAPMRPRDADAPLTAQSGILTIWRRHHVWRELIWDSEAYREINWPPVVDNYGAAHVILVPPKEAPIHNGDLFSAATLKDIVDAMAADPKVEEPTKSEFVRRGAQVAFSRNAMYPLPLMTLTEFEASPLTKASPPTDPKERFKAYTQYLTGQNSRWPNYDLFVPVARKIREALHALKTEPGLVILRARHMPRPDFAALLPPNVAAATKAEQNQFAFSRGVAVGMDYGIVFLDNVNDSRYQESYFVSHEIAHCLFGSHAFEASSVEDHDKNDKNCIMYYNEAGDKGNGGVQFGWAVKQVPQKYQMRLLVEYDVGQKTECGEISEAWVKDMRSKIRDTEWRVFLFTGSVEEIQNSFRRLKFMPAKWLGERKVKLCLDTCLGTPPISPELSVDYPYNIQVPAGGGTVRPLEKIVVKPVNIKAFEPRFCGKCVLKLRGWRVRAQAGHSGTAPVVLPEKSRAVPINGRMYFRGYSVEVGDVTFSEGGADRTITFGLDAKDPGNTKVRLGPFSFRHWHEFKWKSSTGNLDDLRGMPTREVILYERPTQVPPFNEYADPDQKYAQTGGGGSDGSGGDMHSMRLPALICSRVGGIPLAGSLKGTQSYQYCLKPVYSMDPNDWVDIPDSQFLLEKSVYWNGKVWVMMFRKTNRPPNSVPFHFEVHYVIGPRLSFVPDLTANQFAGATQAAPVINPPGSPNVQQLVWAAGARTLHIKSKSLQSRSFTIEELIKKGMALQGSPVSS